jgi:hypothetical protein
MNPLRTGVAPFEEMIDFIQKRLVDVKKEGR